MRTLVTILAILAVLVALVLLGIYSGAVSVAADQPEGGLTHWLLDTTKDRSVASAAEGIEAPSLTDPARIETGAQHYGPMCETCHGAPGVEPSEIGQGLNPKPPELSHAAQEWEPSEMFWIVKHGIKMTGMPSFGATHGDDEIWALVAFVRQLPEMSPDEYRARTAGGGDGHSHGESEGHGHEAGEGEAASEGADEPAGEHSHEGHEHGDDGADAPAEETGR